MAPTTTAKITTTTEEVPITITTKEASTTTVIETTTSTAQVPAVSILGESTSAQTPEGSSNQEQDSNRQDSKPWFTFAGIGGAIIAVGLTEEYLRRNRRK